MGFKEHVARDVNAIYQNIAEHADLTRVRYNSKRARRIPVIFDNEAQAERTRTPRPPIQGRDSSDDIFTADRVVYIALSDLNTMPRRETRIEIDNEVYNIVRASDEAGIVRLWLEMIDE